MNVMKAHAAMVAIGILAAPAAPLAARRDAAYAITAGHLIKASLCATAEGNPATLKRAASISKARLIRAGYTPRRADETIRLLLAKLRKGAPAAVPYVRKICVDELRELERR